MSGILTNFWGAVLEAWTELRIHRTRVLLSLVGVAVAVTALTSVVGLGQVAQQATVEQMERQSGRPASLSVNIFSLGGEALPVADTDAAFASVVDRYSIDYSSRMLQVNSRVQFVDGAVEVYGTAMDIDYGEMHRVALARGAWFTEADESRLAPAVIVNEYWWNALGAPDLATHPTVQFLGERPFTAVIIGVTPSPEWDQGYQFSMLYSAYERVAPPTAFSQQSPQYEVWVPPELADQLTVLIQRDVAGALGDGAAVDIYRQDYLAYSDQDPLFVIKLLVGGVAVLVLLLGALGLVNISLVTVRQRIREIGIRRSFGATAGRVFFAVMMESIVATFVAGVVGVVAAVLIVQSPMVQNFFADNVADLPPFPLEAAAVGIGAAVAVGALAGLLPALVAVRVKVIDAIRY